VLTHHVKRGTQYDLVDRVGWDTTGHTNITWTARRSPGTSPVMTLPATATDAGGGAATLTVELTATETQAAGNFLYEYSATPPGGGDPVVYPRGDGEKDYGTLEVVPDLSLAIGDIPVEPGQTLEDVLAPYTLDATLALDATKGPNAVAWDGAADDTAKLAALATSAVALGVPLRLPPGIGRVTTWTPPNGLAVYGAGPGRTIIKQHQSATGINDVTIDVSSRSNVSISDLTIDGSKELFGAVASEWKHCIEGRATTGLRLVNVELRNAKGDGLCIGHFGSSHSSDVAAIGLHCHHNHRNGLSIIDLSFGRFTDCRFTDQSGTSPQDGVDIEPNDNTAVVRDIRFVNCDMADNAGDGLGVVMFPGGQEQYGVKVTDCVIRGNGLNGLMLYGAMGVVLTATDIADNAESGITFVSGAIQDVTLTGGAIMRNGHHGIYCQPTAGSTVRNAAVIGTTIYDNGAAAGAHHGMIWDQAATTAGSVDGVTLRGVTSGNRATTNQVYGAYFSAAVTNLHLDGCDFRGNATSGAIFNDNAATRRHASTPGVTIIAGVTTSSTLANHIRRAFCMPTAPITVTLPPAPEENADYIIMDGNGTSATNTITVAPSAGHSYANIVGSLVINQAYQQVRMYFYSNKWWVLRDQL
jgi:hypothetical protein